ncbi:hypothetical protein SynRS9909_00256 [Synechococcus sp. RS9909]|nr:hypothetical protein SynRS9909_00256 [Synechococcus sp. RS9909]
MTEVSNRPTMPPIAAAGTVNNWSGNGHDQPPRQNKRRHAAIKLCRPHWPMRP